MTPPGQPGEKKNIVRHVLLPHWDMKAPIMVGDLSAPKGSAATGRVFLMCNDGWQNDAPLLLCYAARDGCSWWGTWPPELLEKDYPAWRANHDPDHDVLAAAGPGLKYTGTILEQVVEFGTAKGWAQ